MTASSFHALRRHWTPRVLNLLLWLAFCLMTGTGLLLSLRLPPGSRGGHGAQVLGMSRHEWGDLHTWISYGFMALILLHLMMHRLWLWQMAARRRLWPLLLGLLAGLILSLSLLLLPVKEKKQGAGRSSRSHESPSSSLHQRSGPQERIARHQPYHPSRIAAMA
ncbi:MAG: DUF4405 domain-containing protein [Blastochloris sp.]|nr:DUF4405 domain-containing protein [Blastochloris sp.]